MSAYYKIGEFADRLGISISTLRRWDKEGKLKPAKVTDGGTRLYSDYQLRNFERPEPTNKIVLAYSKNNLNLLEQYLVAKGIDFQIEDSLMQMISLVESNKVSQIVFYKRDDICLDSEVLSQSAFMLFKTICDMHEVHLTIVCRRESMGYD